MLKTPRQGFSSLLKGSLRRIRDFHSVVDPKVRHLFEYTSGRFLFNEQARLAERFVPFNIDALKYAVARSIGKENKNPPKIGKWLEGTSSRLLTVDFDDGDQVVVKIPYKSALPRKLTTESEVATTELLRLYGIPVAQVHCWGSDCDNEVGAAYIAMSKADGTPLSKIWNHLTREEILPLLQSFVELEAKIFELPFNAYGSIYYSDGVIPPAFQTELLVSGPNAHEFQTTKFCIGPLAERSFWRGKLFDMEIDRGPFSRKERELARKYGKSMMNSAPFTDIIKGTVTPDDFIDAHEKYLTITPYILPSSLKCPDCRPMLRHPRLEPDHIFLNEEGRISSLTGWQYSSILPSLLVCGNPDIFCYPDSMSFEEPTLPSNYSRLPPRRQEEAYLLWRDQMLYYYYALFTSLMNETHSKAMLTPFQPVISHMVSSAGAPWTGDPMTFKCAIVRFVQEWDRIMLHRKEAGMISQIPECALDLDDDAAQRLLEIEQRWSDAAKLKESWRRKIGIGKDGWIESARYDEAVKINNALKEEWMKRHSHEKGGSMDERGQWPFDDHEEPE
ncbi:Phosphotransferase enzyme [Ascosphaera aggregata]|nr:Phosphotransferase enzyme [Ascosphaera aggregata]